MDEAILADSIEPEPIEWAWRQHIPRGMISLIAGRPGEGKSQLAALIAAYLSRTEPVIFSNREDPLPQVVVPRLRAAGAKMENIHLWSPWLPRDTVKLRNLIEKTGAKTVFMDPISAHISSSIYNDQDVRVALSPLSEVASETGAAIICIHHTIKNSAEGHPLRSIGGSGGGLPGVARAAFIFGLSPNDSDERILAPAKFNVGPMPGSCSFEMDEYEWVFGKGDDAKTVVAGRLMFKGDNSKVTATQVLAVSAGTTTARNVDKVAEAAEWLTQYLSWGRRRQKEVQEDSLQYGHSYRTIRRAAEEVGIEKTRHGFGKGGEWWWKLPQGHPGVIPKCCDDPVLETDENLLQSCATCKTAFGLTSLDAATSDPDEDGEGMAGEGPHG